MKYDSLIIGAGAAGMMCAIHTKGKTLLVDHSKASGKKIEFLVAGDVILQMCTPKQKSFFQKISIFQISSERLCPIRFH